MSTYWLTNPLANTMVASITILLLTLFAGAGVALLLLRLRYIGQFNGNASTAMVRTPEKVLWQRYLTWSIIALLFVGTVFSGPLAIAVLCAFLCWQGGREYATLTSLPNSHRIAFILGGWATLAATLLYGSATLLATPILAFFVWSVLMLFPMRRTDETEQRFTLGVVGLWGYFYLGWLPAYLLALSISKTQGLVFVVGLGVALSDVGAFCSGKLLGGPRLAPRLSPGKTWSGVLGNILGAALALTLTAFALPTLHWWQWIALTLTIGIGSIWGDLIESLLKRQYRVKDAGALLPGFGGLLDRIDSLLFVAPLVYYLMQLTLS